MFHTRNVCFPISESINSTHDSPFAPAWRNRAKMGTIRARPFLIDIAPSASGLPAARHFDNQSRYRWIDTQITTAYLADYDINKFLRRPAILQCCVCLESKKNLLLIHTILHKAQFLPFE